MSDTSTETIIDHAALIDRRAARALDASAWVALHVPRFNCAAPLFAHYKDYLHEVLEQACERLAANGHVESRTKELASYARKILKKRDQYLADQNDLPVDPLLRTVKAGNPGRAFGQVLQFIGQVFNCAANGRPSDRVPAGGAAAQPADDVAGAAPHVVE